MARVGHGHDARRHRRPARGEGRRRGRPGAPVPRRRPGPSSSSTCWPAGSSTTSPTPSITRRRARSCSTPPRSRPRRSAWIELREARTDEESGRTFGVVGGCVSTCPDAPLRSRTHALPEELVREWLLPAVYERLRTGRGEFLAELRPAYPVFLRFGGIDYDDDDRAIAQARPVRAPGAGGDAPVTAATSCSSPSATRARTCTACSGRRSPTRTTRRGGRRGARAARARGT